MKMIVTMNQEKCYSWHLKKILKNNDDNYEEEGEVNLEGELISALCDLKNERKKNKHLKEELSKMKESIKDSINPEETKKVLIDIKVKLEEAKMIEETLKKK